jgi:tetraacyldisaccharide 4'-kinase
VEYLIRLLSDDYKIATLSRGYGRKTKGYRVADKGENAKTIGDEPLQLFLKYGDRIKVTVCEERAFAIPHIIDQFQDTQVIIMDDAFQHRKVKPGIQILLTEHHRPFYDDHVIPYGRLREGPESAARADVILVTKCPTHIDENEMMKMQREFKEFSDAPVFFACIRYGTPRPFGGYGRELSNNVVLISGIANHEVLEAFVSKNYNLVKHFVFNDHHNYTLTDLKRIERFVKDKSGGDLTILTTEKDMAKLRAENFVTVIDKLPFFCLPIEMEFIGTGKDFDAIVLSFLKGFSGE